MSTFNFELVSQRHLVFLRDGMDSSHVLDSAMWKKIMSTFTESKFFKNDNSGTELKSKINVINPELPLISQNAMSDIWDNKEDEFWDTY